ncbi:MAG: DUF4178 domain-containing protein [Bradymonadia bacterium]
MGPFAYMMIGIGVAVAVGLLISRRKKQADARAAQRQETLSGANIQNDISRVGAGGVLALPRFLPGETGSFETYVKSRNRYSDGESTWYELICEDQGRDVLVEWQRDGRSIVISVGLADQNPTLDDLGLDEAGLIAYDEGQAEHFTWGEQTWTYVESCERHYYEGDGAEGEGLYAWEFRNDDNTQFLTVEKYAGEDDFEVYHQHRVPTDQVNVFDAGNS